MSEKPTTLNQLYQELFYDPEDAEALLSQEERDLLREYDTRISEVADFYPNGEVPDEELEKIADKIAEELPGIDEVIGKLFDNLEMVKAARKRTDKFQ